MQQQSLFDEPAEKWWSFSGFDADVKLLRGFYARSVADDRFAQLRDGVPWKQDKITLYGKTHDLPRLQRWYGDDDTLSYTWSGITMQPKPWSPLLAQIKADVEKALDVTFNSALLNYYRTGQDYVSWHADDEPGVGPTIASVSLGADRAFLMRHHNGAQLDLELTNGSLLVMAGATQESWKHCLPRRANVGPRINITFRQMRPR